MFKFDSQSITAQHIQSRTIRMYHQNKTEMLERLQTELQTHKLGFVNLITGGDKSEDTVENYPDVDSGVRGSTKLPNLIDQCEAVMDQIAWAETLVVIGIGGSDLGGRAIQQALQGSNPPMRVIFTGDTTDPVEFAKLSADLDLTKTVFNVISKSGGTVETVATYVFWQDKLRNLSDNWHRHFVFTTDPHTGLLHDLAREYDILTLPIPTDVGGRFSVLSSVGILPALAMGIDASELWSGANAVLESTIPNLAESLAVEMAWQQFCLWAQGVPSVVMMPYSTKLNEFARWFRQLWAESLGKDGKGVLPVQAFGPADQHSQLQFYTQGPLLSSFLFLKVMANESDVYLPEVDLPEYAFLSGKSFQEIIHAEHYATSESLIQVGRPVATLEIPQVDAYTLGGLFITFELAVVVLGYLLDVNPFDQPGVEASKKLIRHRLQPKLP